MLALVLLCILMFIGCYVAGYIPLAFNYSPHNLRLVTIFGAGLLVGAALAIIIPEGVSTIYTIQQHLHVDHDSVPEVNGLEARHLNHLDPVKQNALLPDVEPVALPPAVNKVEATAPTTTKNHGLIGLALTMGFVLMFLVDHLGNEACARPLFSIFHCICCQRRTSDLLLPTASDADGGDSSSTPMSSPSPSAAALAAAEHSAMTTTLGLVVHSLADGLAIGAAFGLTLDLTLILFVAIMLHKAPAAFGFVSFLVHEGLPRNRVRVYLFVFALASPVGAILTYLIISTNAYLADQQALSMSAASTSSTGTGFALLLSGGTFLYVATAHILPHLNTEKPISSSSLNAGSYHRHQSSTTFKPIESIAFVFGSCVPVLIAFGHSH